MLLTINGFMASDIKHMEYALFYYAEDMSIFSIGILELKIDQNILVIPAL